MNAIKFLKIDLIRTSSQNRLLVIFAVISVYFAINANTPIWSLLYLCFGSIIISATPFALQTVGNGGFINLLPATTLSRVIGRYLYSIAIIVLAMIFGEVSVVIYYGIKHEVPDNMLYISLLVFAVTLIIHSIQNVVLYFLGNIKSLQLMAIIRMIPGFAMFFGSTYLLEYLEKHSMDTTNWVAWFYKNFEVVVVSFLILSIIILIVSIWISNIIVSKRDNI